MTDELPIDACTVVWTIPGPDDVTGFLISPTDGELSIDDGWLDFVTFAWLAAAGDGSNEREYFEQPQRLLLPAWRVRDVYVAPAKREDRAT
jgi:hypothetical protein